VTHFLKVKPVLTLDDGARLLLLQVAPTAFIPFSTTAIA
jgi:hypothetical protein